MRLAECSLYTFVDTAYLRGREPGEVARQLCDGGSDLIQLRAKTSTPDEIRRMAEALLPITRAAGIGLVINDHWALARDVGAEFCHLGQEDFFELGGCPRGDGNRAPWEPQGGGAPGLAPSLPGPARLQFGLSSHTPDQAQRAIAAGAAYIAIGPVYATPTKPAAKPVTLEYVRWAAANVKIPWFAIGGINLRTIDEVLGAGARRVCVLSAILNSIDVAKACQQFKQRLLSAP